LKSSSSSLTIGLIGLWLVRASIDLKLPFFPAHGGKEDAGRISLKDESWKG